MNKKETSMVKPNKECVGLRNRLVECITKYGTNRNVECIDLIKRFNECVRLNTQNIKLK